MDQPAPSDLSPRVRLATVARDTALSTEGVHGLDAGAAGLFLTAGGGARVPGVRCLAAPGGGFDLALRLVCELVPLTPVADRVRAGIERAAAADGFELESVTITIADVAGPPDAEG